MSPFQTPQKPPPPTTPLSAKRGGALITEDEEEEHGLTLSFDEASESVSPLSLSFGEKNKESSGAASKLNTSTNPFDEDLPSISPLSSLSSGPRTSITSTNPFDNLPDLESDSHSSKTGSRARSERESVSERVDRSPVSKPVPVTSKTSQSGDDLMARSVPSETGSRLKSYIPSFIKGKKEDPLDKKGRVKSHARSQSQDYKVPPLPEAMKERSLEKLGGVGVGGVASKRSDKAAGGSSKADTDHQASGGERKSSGSGSGSRRSGGLFSVTSKKKQSSSRKTHHHSSSETEENKAAHSPVCPYKEDDPTYIHNSFQVHFNLEVFDNERKEKFQLAAKVRTTCTCNGFFLSQIS